MAVNVCPDDRVQASVQVVWELSSGSCRLGVVLWELLLHPAGYGRFWEMTVDRVEPEGQAAVGQGFLAWTLCRRSRIDGEILEVDAERRAQLHAPLRLRLLGPAGVA